MRVLVISVFPPAEVPDAEHAYRISAHLAERGINVHVLTQQGAAVPEQANLHLHPVMRDWSGADLPRLARTIRRLRPDAVLLVYVGHMYHARPMITFAVTVTRLVSPKTRFVTQIEHPYGAVIGTRRSFAARLLHRAVRAALGRGSDREFGTLLRDSSAVILLSTTHTPRLKSAFPDIEAKSVLIPPPVLMCMSHPENEAARAGRRETLGVKPGETLLAYLGYIYQGKGVETLLTAFEQVCQRRSDMRLVIIGGTLNAASDPRPEYVQEVYALAARAGIRDRVFFTGGFDVESEEPSKYLYAADIAVLPLDPGIQLNNSSFGGVVAHGLPVITTQGDILEPPFAHGQNVFLCPPRSPNRLAEAIEMVADDKNLRRKLQEGAQQIAQECFSWDRAIDRTISALQHGPVGLETAELLPQSIDAARKLASVGPDKK